jgi:cytochrome c5
MSAALRPALIALAWAAFPAAAFELPVVSAELLERGHDVWQGTCKGCHANPDADAPQITDRAAWSPRLAKGPKTLYASALGGFKGPSGTEMPPRGGNKSLTDEEVRAAVDYMIRAANMTPERRTQ